MTSPRKVEHLELALSECSQSGEGPGWGDVRLVHDALPEVDLQEVRLGTKLLGHELAAPVVIAAMTGGHERTVEVNATLASAAERYGVAMGVGSQRVALEQPRLAETYRVTRKRAPHAFLIANIGAAQLIEQDGAAPLGVDALRRAVEMIRADALAVHLNFLEELVQPEGDRRARGCGAAIAEITAGLGVPVIAKETGAGLSRQAARRLRALNVAALDVGGLGGTSFAAIERIRAERHDDSRGAQLGAVLEEWGIPTAVSVIGAAATGLPVIATGGVRSGLDAAKALALGATAVGVGRPLLEAAVRGEAAVDAWIEQFLEELRSVLVLTGSADVGRLPRLPVVVLGQTRAWLDDLDYRVGARRRTLIGR